MVDKKNASGGYCERRITKRVHWGFTNISTQELKKNNK